MSAVTNILSRLIEPVTHIVDKAVTDKDLAKKLSHELQMELLTKGASELEAATKVIVAEAKSESALARNWRPVTMIVFAGAIVAHFFGLTDANLSDAEVEWMMRIIALGIGGYTVGRSGEKIMTAYTQSKK